MRVLKTLGILLLVLIALFMVLMLVLPVRQRIERNIIINAKPAVVYNYLALLSNFNKWCAWSLNDTGITYAITGKDGTPGAINSWKQRTGRQSEGRIQITSLEINQEIEFHISFLSPKRMEADSEFDLYEVNGKTKLVWTFELSTPRPGNLLNIFTGAEDKIGDFENALRNVKADIERPGSMATAASQYEVTPLNFPSTGFVIYRQDNLPRTSLPSFYETHLARLLQLAGDAGAATGTPTGLLYAWDETGELTDAAAALPLTGNMDITNDSIQKITIPATKAVYTDHYGDPAKAQAAYTAIRNYLEENDMKQQWPVIEQYIAGPATEANKARWLTRIIVLVE